MTKWREEIEKWCDADRRAAMTPEELENTPIIEMDEEGVVVLILKRAMIAFFTTAAAGVGFVAGMLLAFSL